MSRNPASPGVALLHGLLAAAALAFSVPAAANEWTDSQIQALKSDATTVRNALSATRNNLGSLARLREVVDLVEENLQRIDADALLLLELGRLEIETALGEQAEALDQFLGGNQCGSGSPCRQFKHNIVQLFTSLHEITHVLLAIDEGASTALALDFRAFAALVDAAPGHAVYPLYVAVNAGSNLFAIDLELYFAAAAEEVKLLRTGIQPRDDGGRATSTGSGTLLGQLPGNCPIVMGEIGPERFGRAQQLTRGLHFLTGLVAFGLKQVGHTGFKGLQLGVHGYIGGNLTNNLPMKIGLVLEGISDSIGMVASHAGATLRYCTLALHQAELLADIAADEFPGARGVGHQQGKDASPQAKGGRP